MTFLMIIMGIISIILIASILLQSSNSDGLSGSIGGGAEQLFGRKKSRGYEGILSRISTICAVLFRLIRGMNKIWKNSESTSLRL